MSDNEMLIAKINSDGYVPKTSMENLTTMIWLYFDNPDMDDEYDRSDINECFRYIEESGGWEEFDYEL